MAERAVFRRLAIRAGEWMSQRTIAKEIGLTPTSVSRAITLLKKQDLVTIRVEGPSKLVTLNTENSEAITRKRVENLALLMESNLVETLNAKYPGKTIILFGSYARGEDTTQSDIDIAIIGVERDETNTEPFEKHLERSVNIQAYKNANNIDSFVKTNLHNGIVLSGGWQ